MATKENKKTVKPVKAENLKLKVALKDTHKAANPKLKSVCGVKLITDKPTAKEKLAIAATALRALADFLLDK